MTILHIANYYGGTEVYKNLIVSLDNLGVKQIVYVPLHANNHNRIGQQLIDFKTDGSEIIYSTIRKWYHRFLYRNKISAVYRDLCNRIDVTQITVIHASTLCLDGAVAYEINKKYHIPYVVGISNTDVNVYYKRMFFERGYFAQILKTSQKVLFVSPSYKKLFTEKIIDKFLATEISSKQITIPFGLNDYYINNINRAKRKLHTPIRLLYVGAFLKSKNLDKLIIACESIQASGLDITLTLIGRGMSHRNEDTNYLTQIDELANTRSWLELKDKVGKEELIKQFTEHDIFVMPSFTETFGLVYGEALTQGCPILYTKTQGFDDFFPQGEVGYGVNPHSTDDIAEKIKHIVEDYTAITERVSKAPLEELFTWNKIGEQYCKILKRISL